MTDIVLTTCGMPEQSEACLRALLNTNGDWQILWMDGDPVFSPWLTFKGHPRIRYYPMPATSYAQKHNKALAISFSDYIAQVHDDCIVPRNWLESLIERMEDNPMLGAVVPQVENPATGCQGKFGKGKGLIKAEPHGFDVPFSVPCVLLRKAAIGKGPVFDETFPAGWCSDTDLQLRLHDEGWELGIDTDVVVNHIGRVTTNELYSESQKQSDQQAAFELLKLKWLQRA